MKFLEAIKLKNLLVDELDILENDKSTKVIIFNRFGDADVNKNLKSLSMDDYKIMLLNKYQHFNDIDHYVGSIYNLLGMENYVVHVHAMSSLSDKLSKLNNPALANTFSEGTGILIKENEWR